MLQLWINTVLKSLIYGSDLLYHWFEWYCMLNRYQWCKTLHYIVDVLKSLIESSDLLYHWFEWDCMLNGYQWWVSDWKQWLTLSLVRMRLYVTNGAQCVHALMVWYFYMYIRPTGLHCVIASWSSWPFSFYFRSIDVFPWWLWVKVQVYYQRKNCVRNIYTVQMDLFRASTLLKYMFTNTNSVCVFPKSKCNDNVFIVECATNRATLKALDTIGNYSTELLA
jgi:hypothetical protein